MDLENIHPRKKGYFDYSDGRPRRLFRRFNGVELFIQIQRQDHDTAILTFWSSPPLEQITVPTGVSLLNMDTKLEIKPIHGMSYVIHWMGRYIIHYEKSPILRIINERKQLIYRDGDGECGEWQDHANPSEHFCRFHDSDDDY